MSIKFSIKDSGDEFRTFNMDKFLNGQSNVLLITGFSGSGKSTLAERYAHKYDIVHIELDKIDPSNPASYEMVSNDLYAEENQLYSDFLNINDDIKTIILKRENEEDTVGYVMKKFIPYCIKWCKEKNYAEYAIEGVQIYKYPESVDKHLPIIVMNTSAEESAERKYKRDLEYDKKITSKQNVEKLNNFIKYIKEEKVEKANMKKTLDSKTQYKMLPLTNDLIYKFKDKNKNHLDRCKFDESYRGIMITNNNESKMIGYIAVKDNRMTALEVLPEYKNENLVSKLIKAAIEKFGLNTVNVNSSKRQLIKNLSDIGFYVVSNINDLTLMKLKSVIIRKNDYQGMKVRRENGVDADTNKEEFIYYFSISTDQTLDNVGRVVIVPSDKYIVSVELYDKFNTPEYLKKLLDFATIEKGCSKTRLVYGSKEKLEEYEKYGFQIVQKVKNSRGKFYVMELVEKVRFQTDTELMEWLEDNITTCEFNTLMSSLEVEKQLCGSSHDQAQFILEKMPIQYNANAILVLEKNDAGKILKSHTAVYYQKEGKYYWIENVLANAAGINGPFDSIDDLEEAIEKKFDYINKKKDRLDFIPIYVKFYNPVSLEEYINGIINLEV